jgi:hypothetical protein
VMRWGRGLVAAVVAGTSAVACSSILGLGDLERVDCVGDCNDGTATQDVHAGGDAPADVVAMDAGETGADATPTPESGLDAGGLDATDGGYVDPGIMCGAKFCDPRKMVCCLQGDLCQLPGNCQFESLACDDSVNCATAGLDGDICCGDVASNSVLVSQCVPAAKCGVSNSQKQLCNPKAPNACTGNQTCTDLLANGYYACQ